MTVLLAALASLATLAALSAWAHAVPTRAGESGGEHSPTARRRHAGRALSLVLTAQSGAAVIALGWAGGPIAVACAWQLLGIAFVLAWNAWPQATACWSSRIGWTALAAAVLLAGLDALLAVTPSAS